MRVATVTSVGYRREMDVPSTVSLALLVVGMMTVSTKAAPSDAGMPRLRPVRPSLHRALAEVIALSPTVRGLVGELERSDVIIHIVHVLPS